MAKITCEKCGRTKDEKMFYMYNTGKRAQMCKDCTLMHVNIWQPETFLWLLQKYNVPWLPWEWDRLREKAYIKDPKKKNDTTVFGKYLSLMKLKQHKGQTWADSDELQRQHQLQVLATDAEKEQLDNMYAEQFENGEISQAQYRTLVSASIQKEKDRILEQQRQKSLIGQNNFYDQNNYVSESQVPDLAKDLTDEDKKMLLMKWGRLYKPAEWIQLETFYNDMMSSFDIQDADTRSTLILICKNNLKMNQAINQE